MEIYQVETNNNISLKLYIVHEFSLAYNKNLPRTYVPLTRAWSIYKIISYKNKALKRLWHGKLGCSTFIIASMV